MSGRQAQYQSRGHPLHRDGLNFDTNQTARLGGLGRKADFAILPVTEPFELGPVVDVIPYVLAMGEQFR